MGTAVYSNTLVVQLQRHGLLVVRGAGTLHLGVPLGRTEWLYARMGKSIGDKIEGASSYYIRPRNNLAHVHGTLKYAFSRSAVLRLFLPFQSGRSRKMGSISRSCSISIMHTTQCTDSNWFISSNRFMVDKSWYIEEHWRRYVTLLIVVRTTFHIS